MYESWGLQSKSLGKSRNFNTAWKAPRGHTLAFSPIQTLETSSIAAVKGLNFSPSSSLECTFSSTHLHSVIKKICVILVIYVKYFIATTWNLKNTPDRPHEFSWGLKIFRTYVLHGYSIAKYHLLLSAILEDVFEFHRPPRAEKQAVFL